ncbi:MAG: septation protein SpoVG family protein, partial [Deltaproteobacteria bacterium]|nr:septation protein SpoVG family protein [Deltaproteobacteria bacterium]
MNAPKISEVTIQFIKPFDGLIGFASLVLNGEILLSCIGIYHRLDGSGYRITYPTKKNQITTRPIFHPISRPLGLAIEHAI